MIKALAACALTLGLLCPWIASFAQSAWPPPPSMPWLDGYYVQLGGTDASCPSGLFCLPSCFVGPVQIAIPTAQGLCISKELALNGEHLRGNECWGGFTVTVSVDSGPWQTSQNPPYFVATHYSWLKWVHFSYTPIGPPLYPLCKPPTGTFNTQMEVEIDHCAPYLSFDGIDLCTYEGLQPKLGQLSITASSPFIPGFSVVVNRQVLTESELTLTVTKSGQPDVGISVPLQSDRGNNDQIDDGGVTDGFGRASASVSTRDQPGTSTITSASSDIETVQPGVITWLPAKYALPFLITCYAVAQESRDKKGAMEVMPGIPGQHHSSFIHDTRRQGTGALLNGDFVQWDKALSEYRIRSCPSTASGRCAAAGTTIAVDPKVIPLAPSHGIFGQVSISGIGSRTAEDTGGAIKGYHIDVFYGPTADDYDACIQAGTSYPHTVTFLNYGN